MRDRESVEIERKNAIRNLEKQAKVVERLADSEKNLQQQIVRSLFFASGLYFVSYHRHFDSGPSRSSQPASASSDG